MTVLQLPPGKGKLLFDFHHPPREVWHVTALAAIESMLFLTVCAGRYINHTVRMCDMSGEDPTCQDSLKAKQLRHIDHGTYFNMSSECDPMFTPPVKRRRHALAAAA